MYKEITADATFTGVNVLAPFAIYFKYNAILLSDAGRDHLGSAFASNHATHILNWTCVSPAWEIHHM